MKKFLPLILVLLFTLIGNCQDVPAQQPREDGVYGNLFHFKFFPGKSDEGSGLLKEVLLPAFKEAGIKVTVIEDLMGTKDIYLIIELEDGPRYYESLVPNQDVKLWNALVKVHGSAQKAEEQEDRFIKFVEEQSQTLVYLPKSK